MVNEIAVNQGTGEILEAKTIAITSEQIELVKNTIAKGATDDELRLFIYYCKSRGVHPLDKMIHFVKRKSDDGFVATFQTGIDYFRSSAEDSGEYNGQEGAEFEGETNEGYPYLARVKIYRKGIDRAFVGEARWDEFYPGEKLGFMWRKMPHHMLAKCAEALAFRKAFPKKLAGLYIPEEMQSVEVREIGNKKPEVKSPQTKESTNPTDDLISEAQCKRFYAIAKQACWNDDDLKAWLVENYKIDSTKKISRTIYEHICEKVKEDAPNQKHE